MKTLKKAPCTVGIAAVNVLVFLGLSFWGITEDVNFMLEHGALYLPKLLSEREFYRIFTSMFLHFGFEHLMGNMVMLVALGWQLELELGHIRYLVLYIVSGLCGQIAMIGRDMLIGEYTVSAGASGAIFGIVGALLFLAIKKEGHVGQVSGKGLLVMIVISVIHGFTTPGIAALAHVGSLFAGFVLVIPLYMTMGKGRNVNEG